MTPSPPQPSSRLIRDSRFIRLWGGTTASGLATWALPFVLGLATIHGTISAPTLGLLLAARTVGFLMAVPVGGILADRYSSRQVVLGAGMLAAAASLLLTAAMGRWLIVAATAATAIGMGQGACRPAYQALIPQVVASAQRQAANAAITIAVRVTSLLGPALTALLATVLPTVSLLLGIGALWLVAGLLPGAGTQRPQNRTDRTSILRDTVDGLQEAWRHRWFMAGLGALTCVISFGYSTTSILLPLISDRSYGSSLVFTEAITAYTIGALLGAVIIGRWRPKNAGWAALTGLALYAATPLTLLFTPHPVVIIGAYVLAGIGIEFFNVPWFTATQREVTPEKLARVSSVDFLLSYGLAPLGLALFPPALEIWGVRSVLLVSAVVCLLAPALAMLAPGSRHFTTARAHDEEHSRHGTATPRSVE